MPERCICCGEIIPEGRQVCPSCESGRKMASEKRLIDANALKRQFVDYVRTPPHFHYGDWQNMCINGREIDEVIENAPTVDAVEVVHGKWAKQVEDDCYWYECSECAGVVPRTRWGHDWYSDYCPNCGAKMDGDGNA